MRDAARTSSRPPRSSSAARRSRCARSWCTTGAASRSPARRSPTSFREGSEMILYSGPMSLFTGKVRIALGEKGLAYELVSVPFSRAGYEPKHPKVVELNPKRQVPVLVDGDLAIYDSTIILE